MSMKRTLTLIKNEVLHGPKGAVLVMVVATPLLLGLFVNLAFGNIFTEKAKLGVFDQGDSQITGVLKSSQSIIFRSYESDARLRSAASNGVIDMGLVLPPGFDATLKTGSIKLKAYVWGESMAKNRAIIPALLADAAHQVAGSSVPVNVETVALGEPGGLPWTDRLLPLVVLMAVFFGGLMIPASSLINEKQKHTLEALNVTPATLGDVFAAKGLDRGGIGCNHGRPHPGGERRIQRRCLAAGRHPRDGGDNGCGNRFDERRNGEGHEHAVRPLEIRRAATFRAGDRLYVPSDPTVDRVPVPDVLHD